MASSSEKTENHFCFLLMVPASHPCHVLICCVAAPSVKRLGMIIDLHKKCMTLFVSRRTRDFQTVLPVVCTLSVAWVTKICFDTCGNWSFFKSTSTVLLSLTISYFIYKMATFLSDPVFFWAGTQVLLKWKTAKKQQKKSLVISRTACLLQWLFSWIFPRSTLTSWSLICSDVYCWVFTVRCAYKRTLTN